MQKKENHNPKNNAPTETDPKKTLKGYAKYSSLAFQMIAIIMLGVFGGIQIDKWLNWEFPVFTVVLTIASVVFSVYYSIKDFL